MPGFKKVSKQSKKIFKNNNFINFDYIKKYKTKANIIKISLKFIYFKIIKF